MTQSSPVGGVDQKGQGNQYTKFGTKNLEGIKCVQRDKSFEYLDQIMNCKLWIVNCKRITVHYSARIMNSELWTLIQLYSAPWTRLFCNVHLFRVPRSWTCSVQMKSSMTFIQGNRCMEREKDSFKSREVKRLNECALTLTTPFNPSFFKSN